MPPLTNPKLEFHVLMDCRLVYARDRRTIRRLQLFSQVDCPSSLLNHFYQLRGAIGMSIDITNNVTCRPYCIGHKESRAASLPQRAEEMKE
jgi:hypothetical protein